MGQPGANTMDSGGGARLMWTWLSTLICRVCGVRRRVSESKPMPATPSLKRSREFRVNGMRTLTDARRVEQAALRFMVISTSLGRRKNCNPLRPRR